MKSEDISKALNEIDDKILESANEIRKPKNSKSLWLKWAAAAAAIAVIGFAGLKAFSSTEPPIKEPSTDYPINSESDSSNSVGVSEYGFSGILPVLEYTESGNMAYGWEGYMAYDVSELENGNPWNEDMVFETLPVFRNNSYNEVGIAYPGIGEEAMNEKIENISEKLDLEIQEIVKSTVGEYSSGTGIPDNFVDRIEADFGSFTIELQSNGNVIAMYNGYEGAELPEGYSFTYSNTSEGEAYKAIAYLYENYGDVIGLAEATFVTSKDYTYSGEENRSYNIYDFSGDEINDMLNFAFSGVQLAPNDEGKLMLIRINDNLSCAEKIGDYPIISVDEAKEKLLEGGYITASPYEFPGEKYIAKTELIYRNRTSENIWMPYYRFLIEIPDSMVSQNTPEGLKEFCAYYVPAVESEYITGLPLWNGSFN